MNEVIKRESLRSNFTATTKPICDGSISNDQLHSYSPAQMVLTWHVREGSKLETVYTISFKLNTTFLIKYF